MNTARCTSCNSVVRLPHARSRASHARCEECHRRAAGRAEAAHSRDGTVTIEDIQMLPAPRDWVERIQADKRRAEETYGGVNSVLRGEPLNYAEMERHRAEAAFWRREVELEDAAAERDAHSYDETDAYEALVQRYREEARVTMVSTPASPPGWAWCREKGRMRRVTED